MPVMAPDLKARARPAARLLLEASVVRTFARTETFMPIKPAAPDRIEPIRKPTGTSQLRKAMASTTSTAIPT